MSLRGRCTRAGQQREAEMKERGAVSVYHPGYTDLSSLLFSLPATDGDSQTPGIHRNTIHTACAIIAGNRFDGYFSTTRDPLVGHADLDHLHILPTGTYYFHVPRPLEALALTPYPVVPSFRTWKFPRGEQIPGWKDLNINQGQISGNAEAIWARDRACRVTDSKEAIQIAHIIPRAERQWFALNSMALYCTPDPTAGLSIIDRSSNGILLRSDIHRLWDTYRLLFVPKTDSGGNETSLVAHASVMSAELIELYHNVALQEIAGIPKEYLFARLAYGVFRQLRTFLQSGRDRWLIVQDDDGSVKTGQYSASACAKFAEGQGAGRSSRSPTKSPPKSPKRRRDTADDDTTDYLGSDQESLGEHATRKRRRGSLDPFDPAIASMTQWAEDCFEDGANDFAFDMNWGRTELDEEDAWSDSTESSKLDGGQHRSGDEEDGMGRHVRGRTLRRALHCAT